MATHRFALGLLAVAVPRVALAQEEGANQLRTESRAQYVHRITLYDHDGQAIDPADADAPPYSPIRTCGKCHAVVAVSHGWHFNALETGVEPGRPGEPWLWTDPALGTVLPLSGRAWPGVFQPRDVGLTDWDLTLRFGRHIPGGSFGAGPGDRPPAHNPRWNVSGQLEVDCMACHAAANQYDPAEAARQIEDQNLRWAATAALGLAVIRGQASRLPDDFDPLTFVPNPDDPAMQPPKVVYDTSRFDDDDRVLFDVTLRPEPERCYACHTVRRVGPGAPPRWADEGDVHVARGMGCTSCHKNGIDHNISRGYPGEAAGRHDPALAALSCEGCHLGTGLERALYGHHDAADKPEIALGGRFAAPHPEHRGLPPVHFEKLTCTACHAGPWPGPYASSFQTALAHGLGLPSKTRSDADLPQIIGPVFLRDGQGRIAPQRLVWPQYWGTTDGSTRAPLPLDKVRAAVRKALPARFAKPRRDRTENAGAGGLLPALSPDEIRTVLSELAQAADEPDDTPFYVRDGTLYQLDAGGSLQPTPDHPYAAPVTWAIGHDVRPASQALGARGCTDCHADDGPVDFGRAEPAGWSGAPRRSAAALPPAAGRTMLALRGDDASLAQAWARAFAWRGTVKWLAAVSVLLVGGVLAAYGIRGIHGLSRILAR